MMIDDFIRYVISLFIFKKDFTNKTIRIMKKKEIIFIKNMNLLK